MKRTSRTDFLLFRAVFHGAQLTVSLKVLLAEADPPVAVMVTV